VLELISTRAPLNVNPARILLSLEGTEADGFTDATSNDSGPAICAAAEEAVRRNIRLAEDIIGVLTMQLS